MDKTKDEKEILFWQQTSRGMRPDYVPSKIQMTHTVRPDCIYLGGSRIVAPAGAMYDVKSNQYGAIHIEFDNGKTLGIKPKECIYLEWVRNPYLGDGVDSQRGSSGVQ